MTQVKQRERIIRRNLVGNINRARVKKCQLKSNKEKKYQQKLSKEKEMSNPLVSLEATCPPRVTLNPLVGKHTVCGPVG